MQTPGLGIKDFVSDVGQIVKNRSSRSSKKGRRRKKRGGENSSKSGLYHMPGFSPIVSSQFDDFSGPGGRTRADSSFDDEEFENSSLDSSFKSSNADDRDNGTIDGENRLDSRTRVFNDNNGIASREDDRSPYSLPLPAPQANRDMIQSDETGRYGVDDNGSDNDMELL